MIQIDDTIISSDLFENQFVCDLASCKGICCVEGDAGAPLEYDEIDTMNEILPEIWNDIPLKSQNVINKQGIYYIDEDNEPVTSIVNGRECVFAYQDKSGIWKCTIEKAYREGRINFYKPISCHLYPVRLQKYKEFTAVNVSYWKICDCALTLGEKLKIPVYKFLEEPLKHRFGEEWYEQLKIAAEDLTKNNK